MHPKSIPFVLCHIRHEANRLGKLHRTIVPLHNLEHRDWPARVKHLHHRFVQEPQLLPRVHGMLVFKLNDNQVVRRVQQAVRLAPMLAGRVSETNPGRRQVGAGETLGLHGLGGQLILNALPLAAARSSLA